MREWGPPILRADPRPANLLQQGPDPSQWKEAENMEATAEGLQPSHQRGNQCTFYMFGPLGGWRGALHVHSP